MKSKRKKASPLKFFLMILALICLFSFPPEALFAQDETPPASTVSPGRNVQSLEKSNLPSLQPQAPKRLTPQEELTQPIDTFQNPSLITQAVSLTLLSLLPFIIMILTSFMKIVIVLSLLRNALGVQQAPPNQVINGVAFMLSLFVMYPTTLKMYDAASAAVEETKTPDSLVSTESSTYFLKVSAAAVGPLKDFLKRNSLVKHQALFYRIAYKSIPESHRQTLKPDDIIVLVPAYITSQLKDSFEIGVLIYIPFFVIDLVTSNVLLAMGMMMLSPVTISMPLKLFLLVMLDGWTLLIDGLVATFR
jgi:type III secretion protein R